MKEIFGFCCIYLAGIVATYDTFASGHFDCEGVSSIDHIQTYGIPMLIVGAMYLWENKKGE